MPLPNIPLRREKVEVGGEHVEVRGLTRAEAAAVQPYFKESLEEAEIRILAYATDTAVEDVRVWYAAASFETVEPLIAAASRLSGLSEDSPKGSGGHL